MIIARRAGVWAIRVVHIAFIFYIVISPYWHRETDVNDPFFRCFGYDAYDVIYLAFCGALLVHWLTNSDICFLSKMEELVSGNSYQNGFVHRLVAPIYNLPKQGEWINVLSYAVVLINAAHVYFGKK